MAVSYMMCPFAKEHLDECYAHSYDSLSVTLTVTYCLKNYTECEIFRRKTGMR